MSENENFGFDVPFNGSFEDLENQLSYNFLNLTNYTIVISYYDNHT